MNFSEYIVFKHTPGAMNRISSYIGKIRKAAISSLAATALLIALLSPLPLSAAPSKWETPRQERTDIKTVARDNDVEIKAAKGIIVVSSPKPVQIKVYTILGQLVSRETLPAGTSQLSVSSHGIYIIRTGELTCKVAL